MNAAAEFIPAANAGQQVAEFSQTNAALADLRAEYQGAQFPVTTPAGLKAARAAVKILRDYRTALEDLRAEKVRPLIDEQRLVNAEAKRITGELEALEKPLKLQVDAGDAHREAEKAAAELAERERIARNRANIDSLRNMPLELIGKGADAIADALARLRGIPAAAMVEADFLAECETAMAATLATLETLHASAIAADAKAAELAAQAAELERLRIADAERTRVANEAAAAVRAAADAQAAAVRAEADRVAAAERARLAEAAKADAQRLADAQAIERAMLDAERLTIERAKAETGAANAKAAADAKRAADAQAARDAKAKAAADAEAQRVAEMREAESFARIVAIQTLETAATAAADYLIDIGHSDAPVTRQLVAVLRRDLDRCPAGDFVAAIEAAGIRASVAA